MIAPAKPCASPIPTWQVRFLAILPAILRQARVAFRGVDPEKREDATAEVVASTFAAYARLVELDKEELAYATPLAQYAIRQIRSGRRVGNRLNIKDVSSEYAQRAKGIKVERLDTRDESRGTWQEVVVEDKTAGPADIAATRIDFAAWLKLLRPKIRRIAKALATGETTKDAARKFRLSPGRISQLRRELLESWREFQGECGVV